MTKLQFVFSLQDKLSHLPKAELEERLSFYIEMIEDRMEEGLSEEEAVSAVGSIDEIAAQILSESQPTIRTTSKRKLAVWEVILLILGSPIWLSLLVAAAAVGLSLYVSLWAGIISLWAVFVSVSACAFYSIIGIFYAFTGHPLQGTAMVGAGLVCAGLAILLFYGCWFATKGTLLLTKKVFIWLKSRFRRKEAV